MSASGAWRRRFRLPACPPDSSRDGARRGAHLHCNARVGGVAAATGSSVLARCRAFCLLAPLLAGLPSGAVAQTPTLSVSPTSIDEGTVDTFTFTGFPSNWGPPIVQVSGIAYSSSCSLLLDLSLRTIGFDACGGLFDGTRDGRWDSEGRAYRLTLSAIADHVAEGQEIITVEFQDSSDTSRTASVSIALNDTTRQSFVSVDVVGPASVEEGQPFTVRFSMDPWFMLPSPTTVNYYLADYDGERVVPAPNLSNPLRAYGENPRSVEIPAYHYFVDVEVPTMASADLDGDSKVDIIMLGGEDYYAATGKTTVTVSDANPVMNEDDNTASQVAATPPSVTISTDAASVTEGGEVTFTVTADAAPGIDIAVNLGAAEEMGEGLDYVGREQTGTVTLPADATSATWTVTVWSDERQRADGAVEARIKPGDGYTAGTPSTVTVALLDDDAPAADGLTTQSEGDSVVGDPVTPGVDSALVAQVRDYAAETDEGQEHVDRWMRVLAAFGDDNGYTPMTAAEARTHADKGWQRWVPVVAALNALEAAGSQQDQQGTDQQGTDQSALVAQVRDYAAETDEGQEHVDRWMRVLAAFGDDNGYTPMTAAEARTHADKGWQRWVPVVAALNALEAAGSQQDQQGTDQQGTDQQDTDQQEITPESPAGCVSPELLSDVEGYAGETHNGAAHVERWLRVLHTLKGTANDSTIMLSAEAQTYADQGWQRWVPVVTAIACLEAGADGN